MNEFDASDIFEDQETLGTQLKEAREAMNLSINELHAITKIKESHLEALEADRFDEIAAPVYAKGFIKICAEALGLNAQSLLDQYKKLYLDTKDEKGTKLSKESFLSRVVKRLKKKRFESGVIKSG